MDKIVIEHLSLQYADGTESLRDVCMGIRANAITVLFGPAGGGKSTLLRCLNRLNDLTEVKASSGRILLDGENILDPKTDVIALRRRVGMVFAHPGAGDIHDGALDKGIFGIFNRDGLWKQRHADGGQAKFVGFHAARG